MFILEKNKYLYTKCWTIKKVIFATFNQDSALGFMLNNSLFGSESKFGTQQKYDKS